MDIAVKNRKELQLFAQALAARLKGGEIIALIGELGAGKTTFVKMLLAAAGVRAKVTSPTFVLMVPYKSVLGNFYHLDLYRTGSYKEVQALGIEEIWLDKNNIVLIEWADKIMDQLPRRSIIIRFANPQNASLQTRQINITHAPKNLAKMLKWNIHKIKPNKKGRK